MPAPSLLKEILPEELKTWVFASESTAKPFSYLLNVDLVLVVAVNALWVLAELIPPTLHGLSTFSYLAVDCAAQAQREQSWALGSTARKPPYPPPPRREIPSQPSQQVLLTTSSLSISYSHKDFPWTPPSVSLCTWTRILVWGSCWLAVNYQNSQLCGWI